MASVLGRVLLIAVAVFLCDSTVSAQTPTAATMDATSKPSKFRSPDDGWFDVSAFLDEKYGFLPVAIPITEPAVGYGAAVGVMFISEPLGQAQQAGFGRPDITLLGALGTENGTSGVMLADVRHWFNDRLQTQVGLTHLSANLDFHGIGTDRLLDDHPLRYNLEPTGGVIRVKYRLGETPLWAGIGYAFLDTHHVRQAPGDARAAGLRAHLERGQPHPLAHLRLA